MEQRTTLSENRLIPGLRNKICLIIQSIGPISFSKKLLRKRNAGNPHVAFEAAGDGNRALAGVVLSQGYCAIARPYFLKIVWSLSSWLLSFERIVKMRRMI